MKHVEWGLPCFITQADVRKAFDSMDHSEMEASMQFAKTPIQLSFSIMRELFDAKLSVDINGTKSKNQIPMQIGGKQGGSDTPWSWNRYMDFVLAPVIRKWDRLGYGIDLRLWGKVHHTLWADDFYIFSSSRVEAEAMFRDVTHALHQHQQSRTSLAKCSHY